MAPICRGAQPPAFSVQGGCSPRAPPPPASYASVIEVPWLEHFGKVVKPGTIEMEVEMEVEMETEMEMETELEMEMEMEMVEMQTHSQCRSCSRY